jgi:hypothetical protein
MSDRKKGTPIPVKLGPLEEKALEKISRRAGLPRSEILRRALMVLDKRVKEEGSVGFILDELDPDNAPRTTDESAGGYRAKKNARKDPIKKDPSE